MSLDLALLCLYGLALIVLAMLLLAFVAVIGTAIQQRLGGK